MDNPSNNFRDLTLRYTLDKILNEPGSWMPSKVLRKHIVEVLFPLPAIDVDQVCIDVEAGFTDYLNIRPRGDALSKYFKTKRHAILYGSSGLGKTATIARQLEETIRQTRDRVYGRNVARRSARDNCVACDAGIPAREMFIYGGTATGRTSSRDAVNPVRERQHTNPCAEILIQSDHHYTNPVQAESRMHRRGPSRRPAMMYVPNGMHSFRILDMHREYIHHWGDFFGYNFADIKDPRLDIAVSDIFNPPAPIPECDYVVDLRHRSKSKQAELLKEIDLLCKIKPEYKPARMNAKKSTGHLDRSRINSTEKFRMGSSNRWYSRFRDSGFRRVSTSRI